MRSVFTMVLRLKEKVLNGNIAILLFVSNLYLSGPLEGVLHGKSFANNEKVKEFEQMWFQDLLKEFLAN